jgi:serine/threonine protein kinase
LAAIECPPEVPGYQVEAVLGRGGMGVIFKARHLKLNRPVALKMLLAGTYAGPEELARFRREAEAVAALRHPNIIQVHDADEVTGRPYFTMECVEGGTLAQRLAARPLPPRDAAELLATLASAVQFAHKIGFLHHDLKPGNILLTPDGTPKITDFGLARAIGTDSKFTQTGDPLGTPSYMAPEQARGNVNAVGPATDVYALGAVLFETLTGRPPFEGRSPTETMHKVISELLADDRAGYRRTCAQMIARRQPHGLMRPYLVARACTLAPDATDDPARSLEALKQFDGNPTEYWAYTEQAALHARMNQPSKAAWYAESSMVVDGTPGRGVLNWLWLSLAHQKMGNVNESRRWFDKAANWLDQQDGRMPLEQPCLRLDRHNWLEAHVLRREVKALLSKEQDSR